MLNRPVNEELRSFRANIPAPILRHWEAPTGCLCFVKIAQDWGLLLAGHQIYIRYPSTSTLILAVILMAWGQRGLSNLAHDSIHGNLVKNRFLNDLIADVFLAPPHMSTSKIQRANHNAHHRYLGTKDDPDHGEHNNTSLRHYRTGTYNHKSILALFIFDAFDPVAFLQHAKGSLGEAPIQLCLWWTMCLLVTALLEPPRPSFFIGDMPLNSFFVLYHGTRCTLTYCFYILREIMDHSGLPSTSVSGFTRSSPWGSWFQKFVQPHDDNYHLLHHLLPKIPMSRLREADRWLREHCEEYQQSHHYDGYFNGVKPIFLEELHVAEDKALKTVPVPV